MQCSIFPLDSDGNIIESDRLIQPSEYYVTHEIPDFDLNPDDDGNMNHNQKPDGEYDTIVYTQAEAEANMTHRAAWRQDRDAKGRVWNWEVI